MNYIYLTATNERMKNKNVHATMLIIVILYEIIHGWSECDVCACVCVCDWNERYAVYCVHSRKCVEQTDFDIVTWRTDEIDKSLGYTKSSIEFGTSALTSHARTHSHRIPPRVLLFSFYFFGFFFFFFPMYLFNRSVRLASFRHLYFIVGGSLSLSPSLRIYLFFCLYCLYHFVGRKDNKLLG